MRALTLTLLALSACAGAPVVDVGGVAELDLGRSDDASPDTVRWQWQPTAFHDSGRVPPPSADAWQDLRPDELTTPRGGQGASVVWYRARIDVPARIEGVETRGQKLVLLLAVDDYAEILVDGRLAATAAGYNGVLVAELTPAAEPAAHHEVLVLGVNAPLGKPPVFPPYFILKNEVFLRTPTRLVVSPRTLPEQRAASSSGTALAPYARCAVVVRDQVLTPVADELGARCAEPANDGPRWERYRVMTTSDAVLQVRGDAYGEVWVDGRLDLGFGREGGAAMSRLRGVQSVPVGGQRDAHLVDVLVWPGPWSALTAASGNVELRLAAPQD